jgi:DegV family protein with EDD domain
MPVAVVTDSTAYLPAETVQAAGIAVVPLQVIVGGRAYDEGVDIDSRAVAAALRAWTPVTTSRPSPQALLDIYTRLADEGADAVVSMHISAQMSGTYESAVLAARESPVPTHVVDSRSLGMGLGFLVLEAAASAHAGAAADDIAERARRRSEGVSTYFYVATLEHLRRGGRIGAAAALLGSALAIKPLLVLRDGHIEPLEKVRTASRAVARLEELAVGAASGGRADVAVHHLDAATAADALAARLQSALPASRLVVGEVGAVVGAHVGPGMLAVVVAPVVP